MKPQALTTQLYAVYVEVVQRITEGEVDNLAELFRIATDATPRIS